MKTILCFGDSNTWGSNPRTGGRYPLDIRWTGLLQSILGKDYRIMEEGLPGRTTVWEDPLVPVSRSGKQALPVCLESHMPLDLVVIMLGTNDLKVHFSAPAADIALGAGLLLDIVSRSGTGIDGNSPLSLLVCPPCIGEEPAFDGTFGQSRTKSKQLPGFYRREAEQRRGTFFFDAGSCVETSPVDGVHLEPESHRKLGEALAREISSILSGKGNPAELGEN